MRRILLLLCCLAAFNGCAGLDTLKDAYEGLGDYFGGKDNAEPPAELKDQEFPHKLAVLWKESVGKGLDEQDINLVPAVTEAAVFAADRRGLVRAYNRLTGDRLWETDAELAFSAGPTVGRDKLVLGTSNAEVAAYNAADGALLWKTTVSSEVLAQPRIEGGVVVIRSSDGRITALDEKTGATQWTFERSAPILAVRSRGAPIIVEDLVIDGYGGGKLSALQIKDGKPAWEATVAIPHGRSEIERLVDLDSNPAVRGSTLYVSGYQAGIAAVSVGDGDVQWREDKVSSHTGLVLHRRTLFLTDANSDVWQVDTRDGGDLWKQAELHQRRMTAPAVIKNLLVVGDFEGYLHLLAQDDGSLQGRLQLDGSPIEAAPVVFDDVIYVYTSAGTLAAVSVD
jgi:outer membrane protein assembly factor BamB